MNNNIEDLKHIRSMMERSSKFLSLSGISGISAGMFALLGVLAAWLVLHSGFTITHHLVYDLLIIALGVLLGSATAGLFFSTRKAKKTGSKFWLPVTFDILKDFGVPMVAGGLFSLILIYQHSTQLVAATMLIFYGLALISAGSRTYRDVKILGACEIVLGILAGIFTYNGLLFWAIGFGVLHIVYGAIMYLKYDLKATKKD